MYKLSKKRVLIIIVSIILIGVVSAVIFLIPKGNNYEVEIQNKKANVKVTGKLEKVLNNLNDNYTIKFSGIFLNEQEEVVNSIVEFTKYKDNFAIKSDELGIYFVCENDKVKSISTRYKMIAIMPKSAIDVTMYNPVQDFGQRFNKESKDNIDGKEYEVEEYIYNDIVIKYYFFNDDIKIIKYNERVIKVIRIENVVNKDLFNVPTSYKVVGK